MSGASHDGSLLGRSLRRGSAAEVTFNWDGEVSVDGAALWARTSVTAERLQRAGVKAGDVVSLQLGNSAAVWPLHLAAASLGAIVQPVPVGSTPAQAAAAIESVSPVAFVAADDRALGVSAFEPRLVEILTAEEVREGLAARTGRLLPEREPAPQRAGELARALAALDDRRPYLLLSTSGSSGPPKTIAHAQRTLAAAFDLAAPRLAIGDDRFFCMAQATHITGVIFGLFLPLLSGSSCLSVTRWDPSEAAGLIDQHRCTISSAVPSYLIDLYDAWRARGGGGFLERYLTGATDVPTERMTTIEQDTGCVLVRGYGSTEVPMITCGDVRDDPKSRLGLDGSLMPPGEVMVDQPDAEGVGELFIRGPQMALGYWRNGSIVPMADRAGWFHTGDLGRCTEGHVSVMGRMKDVINTGGLAFHPRELDALLIELPGVMEAAAFPFTHSGLGELAAVAIVMAPGIDPPSLAEVHAHFERRSLAPQKRPVAILPLDALPVTESRKVSRAQLTAQCSAAASAAAEVSF
jgi:acyl-CoA synthetase (AMP-forming)/AMP-acid ligase II